MTRFLQGLAAALILSALSVANGTDTDDFVIDTLNLFCMVGH